MELAFPRPAPAEDPLLKGELPWIHVIHRKHLSEFCQSHHLAASAEGLVSHHYNEKKVSTVRIQEFIYGKH